MNRQGTSQEAVNSSVRSEERDGRVSREQYASLTRLLKQANLDLFTDRDYLPQCNAENVIVLAHTHCLGSSHYFFRALVDNIKIPAQNIILLPKAYSTISVVAQRMQALGINVLSPKLKPNLIYDESMVPYVEEICRLGHTLATKLAQRKRKARVLLIDDGGILTRQWLKSRERRHSIDAVSIQQTRSGVTVLGEEPTIPVINAAQSAAKRKFESHYIARAIVAKTEELGYINDNSSVGVFGLGMIGRAVAKAMLDKGHEIYVCDEKALAHDDEMDYWQRLREASSRRNFVNSCDLIFGATAADWLRDDLIPHRRTSTEKVLVSCSSRDREFQYILRQPDAFRVDEEDRFASNSHYADTLWHPQNRRQPFRVLNGGFPINFDRQKEWERPEEIALTRVLILAAVIQGLCTDLGEAQASYIQLDPHIQRELTLSWMRLCNKTAQDFFLDETRINDIDWWIEKSAGVSPDPDSCRVVYLPVTHAKRAPRRRREELAELVQAARAKALQAKLSYG